MQTISTTDLTQPTRHIFLSPHYDDIALSCGGTAALLARAGRTPEIALIFGDHPDPAQPMTDFAATMHRQWGMSAEQVVAGRRSEEQIAALTLGACDRFLPFQDAIYRGSRYTSDDDLFGDTHPDEVDLAGQIISHIGLERTSPAKIRIYAPLAIGGHVDHQHAERAGSLLAEQGYTVWFYEDLPYALRVENVESRRSMLDPALEPRAAVDIERVWTTKVDAIMAYPSQLPTIFEQYVGVRATRLGIEGAMGDYARAMGDGTLAERFWTTG